MVERKLARVKRMNSAPGNASSSRSSSTTSTPLLTLPLEEEDDDRHQADEDEAIIQDGDRANPAIAALAAADKAAEPGEEAVDDSPEACLLYETRAQAIQQKQREQEQAQQRRQSFEKPPKQRLPYQGRSRSYVTPSPSPQHSRRSSYQGLSARDYVSASTSSHPQQRTTPRRSSSLRGGSFSGGSGAEDGIMTSQQPKTGLLRPSSGESRHSTRGPPPPSAKIQFSDTVRIHGGIRRQASRSRTPTRRRMVSNTSFTTHHHNNTLGSGGSGSNSGMFLGTMPQHGSFQFTPPGSRKPSLSRPTSYLSDVSRASTPASLIAPLSLPSKSAPSPSRMFYLTFERQDGQTPYRELVKRQLIERKKRRAIRRRKKLLAEREKKKNGSAGRHQEVPSRAERRRCCYLGVFRSSNGGGNGYETDDEDELEDEQFFSNTNSISHNGERRSLIKRKSEVRVLFGRAPWRWLKGGWWAYRIKRLCGVRDRLASMHQYDEEEETGGW